MLIKKTLPLIIILLLLTTVAVAENTVQVRYKKAANKDEAEIRKTIQSSTAVHEVVSFVNETFRLKEPVALLFGGKEGPLCDRDSMEILIPYHFVTEVKERFEKDGYSETGVSIHDATMDGLMHTLFHEFAHAFIEMYNIPVAGKEEDAADGLADVLLIEFFEGGDEIAVSAADLFDLESEDVETFEEEDFQGEHSLDVQRFYTTLCHVYGSSPDKYKDLPKDAGFSKERAELCIEEYEKLSADWLTLLKPHLKQPEAMNSAIPKGTAEAGP